MRLHSLLKQVALTLTITSRAAHADVPASAIVADTPEKAVLVALHLQEILKTTGHPETERGHWLVALPPDRRNAVEKALQSLPPDKSDGFYTAEFRKAYDGFGADITTRPFCVFAPLSSQPMLYGDGMYRLPIAGEFYTDAGLGEVQVRGSKLVGLDPKKMDGAYEAMQAAYKRLGVNAKLRLCYRFLRVAQIADRPPANFFNKKTVSEWLGGDVVDVRTMQSVVNIPASWASVQ